MKIMRRLIAILFVFTMIGCLGLIYPEHLPTQVITEENVYAEKVFSLTNEEKAFIKNHKTIRVGYDPHFIPFEFRDRNGEYRGLGRAYLNRISEISGLNFEIAEGLSWKETYDKAVNHDIDILPSISETEARKDYFLFSKPYYTFHRVIVMREDTKAIHTIDEMKNKTVAVQLNSSHHSYLELNNVDLSYYDTVQDALEAVALGKEQFFVGNLATTRYILNSTGLAYLKFTEMDTKSPSHLHIAVRNDWPVLMSIIDKSLEQIGEEERANLHRQWVGSEVQKDYSGILRFLQIFGVFLGIALIVSVYWIMRLRSEVDRRNKVEKDLTLAKQEAEEANQVKSHFLARMSHEIRTPLNAITGMSFLLSDTELDSKQQTHVERIKQASDIMLGLINDILDFSKIEAGKIDIENVPFEMDLLIKNVLNVISHKIEEKDLDFTLMRDPNLPNRFIGDPRRIEQVLMNILNNAVKFTREGGITLAISYIGGIGSDCAISFEVIDTGIGISEENIPKLFDAFTQEDASITRRFGGTGLGLSICKSIVDMMQGQISVESEKGTGTAFTIHLPLQMDENRDHDKDFNAIEFIGLRAIILDRNSSQMNMIHSYLSSLGMDVEMTTSTEQLLNLLNRPLSTDRRPHDLIIVDYSTPLMGIDGFYETLESLTSDKPHPKILTLMPFLREDLEGRKDNFHAYIAKPIFPSILLDALLELFNVEKAEQLKDGESAESIEENFDFTGTGTTVLLVEDNITNQTIAKALLQKIGIQIDCADDGDVGIQMYLDSIDNEEKKTKYSLILMDLHMPVLNGYEATQSIRSYDKDIPIMALTADAIAGVEEKCRAYGFTHFTSKPFDPEKLIHDVSNIIKIGQEKNDKLELSNKMEIGDEQMTKVWDKTLGLKLLGGNEKLFTEVLSIYVTENKNTTTLLKEFVSTKNYSEGAELVHKVKSSSGSIGSEIIRSMASELQVAFETEDQAGVEVLHGHFITLFEDLLSQVKEHVEHSA